METLLITENLKQNLLKTLSQDCDLSQTLSTKSVNVTTIPTDFLSKTSSSSEEMLILLNGLPMYKPQSYFEQKTENRPENLLYRSMFCPQLIGEKLSPIIISSSSEEVEPTKKQPRKSLFENVWGFLSAKTKPTLCVLAMLGGLSILVIKARSK